MSASEKDSLQTRLKGLEEENKALHKTNLDLHSTNVELKSERDEAVKRSRQSAREYLSDKQRLELQILQLQSDLQDAKQELKDHKRDSTTRSLLPSTPDSSTPIAQHQPNSASASRVNMRSGQGRERKPSARVLANMAAPVSPGNTRAKADVVNVDSDSDSDSDVISVKSDGPHHRPCKSPTKRPQRGNAIADSPEKNKAEHYRSRGWLKPYVEIPQTSRRATTSSPKRPREPEPASPSSLNRTNKKAKLAESPSAKPVDGDEHVSDSSDSSFLSPLSDDSDGEYEEKPLSKASARQVPPMPKPEQPLRTSSNKPSTSKSSDDPPARPTFVPTPTRAPAAAAPRPVAPRPGSEFAQSSFMMHRPGRPNYDTTLSLSDLIASLPAYVIQPAPSAPAATREWYQGNYGGNRFAALQVFTKGYDTPTAPRTCAFWQKDRNPYSASQPGMAGVIYTGRRELYGYDAMRTFSAPRSGTKRWTYIGDYVLDYIRPLTIAELTRTREALTKLVKQICIREGIGYRRLRATVYLRKMGNLATEKDIESEAAAQQKAYPESKLTEKDVETALRRGEIVLDAVVTRCVGYDHGFANHCSALHP